MITTSETLELGLNSFYHRRGLTLQTSYLPIFKLNTKLDERDTQPKHNGGVVIRTKRWNVTSAHTHG